jgi:hypothetical protein
MDEFQDEEEDEYLPKEKEVYLIFEDEGGYSELFVSAELGFENDIPYVLGTTIEQNSVMSYDDENMTEVFDRYKKAGLTTHLKARISDSTKADIIYKGWTSEERYDQEGSFVINCKALNNAFSTGKLYLEEEAKDERYRVKIK